MMTERQRKISDRLDQAGRLCAKNGALLTNLRRSVLELILAADGPLTAYQLLDQLRLIRKSAVPPTIYRALEFLLENRLVHRIERLNAFIPCTETDHDHKDVQFLICGACGTVAEIEDSGIAKALAKAAEKEGFRPAHAMVELDGICATCSAR
jgi:Fur family zinc uptake transcriptional regulator